MIDAALGGDAQSVTPPGADEEPETLLRDLYAALVRAELRSARRIHRHGVPPSRRDLEASRELRMLAETVLSLDRAGPDPAIADRVSELPYRLERIEAQQQCGFVPPMEPSGRDSGHNLGHFRAGGRRLGELVGAFVLFTGSGRGGS